MTGKKLPPNICDECEWPNDRMRMTCEICGHAMYITTKKRLHDNNVRLKLALKVGDLVRANVIRGRIKTTVDKSVGVFSIDEGGFAIQVKAVEVEKVVED